jgi:hypothetical protein
VGTSDASCLIISFALIVATPLVVVADDPMSLTISARGQVFTSGDEVLVNLAMKNLSEREVPFGFSGATEYDYDVRVFGPDGNPAPDSKAARRRRDSPSSGPSHSIMGTIAPGEENKEIFDLETFADLSTPATYSVQVLWPRKAFEPTVRSNVLVVMADPAPPTDKPTPGAFLSSAETIHHKATPAPLQLIIDTDKVNVQAGAGVQISWRLKNASGGVIHLSPGTALDYVVDARDENGIALPDRDLNTVHKTRMASDAPDPNAPQPFAGIMTITPGSEVTSGLATNPYVDLSKPGMYSIQLWRVLPQAEGEGEVYSKVIVVTVRP